MPRDAHACFRLIAPPPLRQGRICLPREIPFAGPLGSTCVRPAWAAPVGDALRMAQRPRSLPLDLLISSQCRGMLGVRGAHAPRS